MHGFGTEARDDSPLLLVFYLFIWNNRLSLNWHRGIVLGSCSGIQDALKERLLDFIC